MKNEERDELTKLVVAPYIQKATALIGVARKVGGNQFRHMMATFSILIDYHYTDPVMLKASLIHDLFEDVPDASTEEVIKLDKHGYEVVKLALEVSRQPGEDKIEYLKKILHRGSREARIIKVADRISNITDLHLDIIIKDKMASYLDQTMDYIYPMAVKEDLNMAHEIKDLVKRRRLYLQTYSKADKI